MCRIGHIITLPWLAHAHCKSDLIPAASLRVVVPSPLPHSITPCPSIANPPERKETWNRPTTVTGYTEYTPLTPAKRTNTLVTLQRGNVKRLTITGSRVAVSEFHGSSRLQPSALSIGLHVTREVYYSNIHSIINCPSLNNNEKYAVVLLALLHHLSGKFGEEHILDRLT